jgi:two-component system response regulator YesN
MYDDIRKIKPDILLMVSDRSGYTSPAAVKEITSHFSGLYVIVIGESDSCEQVRQYFLNGAFDYLTLPLEESVLEEAVLRVYENFGLGYVVNDLQMKTDALINNIFLGGGEEELIISNLVEQIYTDWKRDPINCRIIADKAKMHIYEIITERKQWLEKFLYRNDFSYHIGFLLKTKEEIIKDWVKCFKEASAMVTKYQMIDDKLVYNIGKYVVVHVDEKMSLESVARDVYLNPSYVSHIFKKVTGMNFSDYMAEVKVDRAKVLLRDANMRIYDVAATVKYSNTEYFSKTFKKKTGYSPVEYQKILQEKWPDEDYAYSEKMS